MTKTLLTISFAIDLDEDALVELANSVEDSMRKGIEELVASWPADAPLALISDSIDFYGATLTLRRPILPEGS